MSSLSELYQEIKNGKRISTQEGLRLFQEGDLLDLGDLANQLNQSKNQKLVGYVVDRNLNYTNICVLRCKFCAFRRDKNDSDSYALTYEEINEKIEDLISNGGTQILMQGGHHPEWKLDHYTALIHHIRSHFPKITIHAFSPPELHHISKISKLPLLTILSELKSAGLQSIPGGGAEILDTTLRKEITAGKCNAEEWLRVFEVAHEVGLQGSATMMFGHLETIEQRVEHLEKLRALQDRTNVFFAFIPWTYVPGNSPMGGEQVGGYEYLKTLAISRIFLDNFQNIQVSWLTQGIKTAQIALQFGGNDLGSTLLEENVVRSTGVPNQTNVPELRRIIQEWGYQPRQRDTFYNTLSL